MVPLALMMVGLVCAVATPGWRPVGGAGGVCSPVLLASLVTPTVGAP